MEDEDVMMFQPYRHVDNGYYQQQQQQKKTQKVKKKASFKKSVFTISLHKGNALIRV